MTTDKRTVCKVCGGRRDPKLGNRMCRPCYNAYVQRARTEGISTSPREQETAGNGDWAKRLRAFEAVFARHGLEAGGVWARVRAVRA